MSARGRLTILLLLSGVFLAGSFGWLLWRFALPRPARVNAGAASDYPPGGEPRLFWQDSTPFYVANADGELLALYAVSSRGVRCRIRWDAERHWFVDPCYGSRMTIGGVYEGGGPPLDMTRLPLEVEEGQVWVEVAYK
jgi:hypothetical protein